GSQLVELARISRRDEAALARDRRQLRCERAPEILHQRAMLAELALRALDEIGPRRLAQQAPQPRRLAQRVAQRREIARPAAAEREARQGALDIGAAPQALAQLYAQPLL